MKDRDDENPAEGVGQSEEDKSGVDRRRFLGTAGALAVGALAGLSGGSAEAMAAARRSGDPVVEWGPRVDLKSLKHNYAPQEVRDFTVPPGGIDNLGLHSTDQFDIPGQGSFEVDFSGYFQVARAHPRSFTWGTSMIRVNILDLRLFGQHQQLGEIGVTLNPDILASGQIFPIMGPQPQTKTTSTGAEPVACRIAVAAVFTVPSVKIAMFNKEPILLMNEHLTRIPPVDDSNGHALLFRLPLFNVQDPHGEPLAYLTSLRYGADHYLSPQEVSAIRARRLQVV